MKHTRVFLYDSVPVIVYAGEMGLGIREDRCDVQGVEV